MRLAYRLLVIVVARRLALDRARGIQLLRAGRLMGEPEHCGDPSCLICYPAITKTGHQITHDETSRWAAEAEQGIRAYSGLAEVSSRSLEQMRGVPGSSRSSGPRGAGRRPRRRELKAPQAGG